MALIPFTTTIEFYYTAAWHTCTDVLQDPGPTWEFGLGSGVMDLVADTGILTFTLDNSPRNSASLAGYYSIGHTNCPAWFKDAMPIRVTCTRTDVPTSAVRFVGVLVAADPTSGAYRSDTVEVEARDWMDYAYIQKLGELAIQTGAGLGTDDALTTALAKFDVQPTATSFAVGKESFAALFDSDDAEKMTMAALFQKYARNEGGGYIYLRGDGTLRFDNRHVRPASTTDSFTLDASASTPMTELELGWSRDDIANRVEVTVYPTQVDTGATTVIWRLRDGFAMSAGQVLVVTCAFVDPDTGTRISASGVVTPLVSSTHIKFGSTDDGTSNDLIGSLTFPMVVGGNTATVTLTAAVAGYVNKLEIVGNGIYRYEPMTLTSEDATSIAARGERVMKVDLEQITSTNTAQVYAYYLKGQLKDPMMRVKRVRFLANFNTDFATAALTVNPNTRFAIKETQTGVDNPLFACRIKYEMVGTFLWVEIIPAMMPGGGNLNYFIWDVAGHGWNEGVWVF